MVSQVEEWRPDIVIISYNGSLDLEEDDFSAMIR